MWDSFREGPKTLSHHLPGPRDHLPLKQGPQGWDGGGGQGRPPVVHVARKIGLIPNENKPLFLVLSQNWESSGI